jgi:hypothetical protein
MANLQAGNSAIWRLAGSVGRSAGRQFGGTVELPNSRTIERGRHT